MKTTTRNNLLAVLLLLLVTAGIVAPLILGLELDDPTWCVLSPILFVAFIVVFILVSKRMEKGRLEGFGKNTVQTLICPACGRWNPSGAVACRCGTTLPEKAEMREVTSRDLAILSLMAGGLTNIDMGVRLGITPADVYFRKQDLLKKWHAADETELVALANALNLLAGDPDSYVETFRAQKTAIDQETEKLAAVREKAQQNAKNGWIFLAIASVIALVPICTSMGGGSFWYFTPLGVVVVLAIAWGISQSRKS